MESDTSILTLELPSEDLAFAEAYAKAHGISVPESDPPVPPADEGT